MFRTRYLLAVLAFVLSTGGFAEGMHFADHKGALSGSDPVAYFTGGKARRGSVDITHDWGGVTWRFESEENRRLFIAGPQKFAPQYGGYCAMAMAKGELIKPDPRQFVVWDDKLYLFYTRDALGNWKRSKEKNIESADRNWATIAR
jgi:hypothetical protein